jgi:murein DD-endopeptidase MepM/ murein hydrolase activator NlpD
MYFLDAYDLRARSYRRRFVPGSARMPWEHAVYSASMVAHRPTRTLTLLLVLAALAAAGAAPPAQPADPDPQALGREATQRFRAGEIGPLWAQMTSRMREALGSEQALEQFRAQVLDQFGEAKALIEETVDSEAGVRVYRRFERFSKVPAVIVTEWSFDADDRIAGFYVRPRQEPAEPAESPHLDYETKNRLRLPFDGEWTVGWGGRTAEQNNHVIATDQRFAYDFLVQKDGTSYRGDGERLADYYCWDRPILAAAAGEVVAAVDGLDDNLPGETDPAHAAGNHVILDLGRGEYALLAHLRKGSLAVGVGDRVTAGRELGRCGNSGNTSEPHLHFHLQDGPRFGEGLGLPAFFSDYLADGEPVARGEPVRGQTVAPADREARSAAAEEPAEDEDAEADPP